MTSKVLLISILHGSHRNLSVLQLYASLRYKGIDVSILFIPDKDQYNSDLTTKFLNESDYGIVGISLMTDGFTFAKQLTADIKLFNKDIFVVWGGIHPTLMPEECVHFADCVCIGEGDITLERLVQRLAANESIDDLDGIAVKLPSGEYKANPLGEIIRDLDSIPYIRYEWDDFYLQDGEGLYGFDVNSYTKYSNYNGEDYTLMTSRSCPYNCSYCCNSYINKLYGDNGRRRRRSVDNVILEVQNAMSKIERIRFINFIDDQFITTKKWNDEFVVKYKQKIGLPFIVRLVPGTFNDNDIKKLKEAGLSFVQIGIQSGSAQTHREIFHRRYNRRVIVESSEILSNNGIFPIYDLIIQNDFEDDSDRDETIKLLLDLKKPFSLTLFALTLFPKTELELMYKQRNIIPSNDPYGKGYSNLNIDDFYYQLCSIIPYTDRETSERFFMLKDDDNERKKLKEHFIQTEDIRNKRVTAQDTFAETNDLLFGAK